VRTVLKTATYWRSVAGYQLEARGSGFEYRLGYRAVCTAVDRLWDHVHQLLGAFRQKHGGQDVHLTTRLHKALGEELVEVHLHLHTTRFLIKHMKFNNLNVKFFE